MLPESSKLLLDIRQALDDIGDFSRGLDLEAYTTVWMTPSFGTSFCASCQRLGDRWTSCSDLETLFPLTTVT